MTDIENDVDAAKKATEKQTSQQSEIAADTGNDAQTAQAEDVADKRATSESEIEVGEQTQEVNSTDIQEQTVPVPSESKDSEEKATQEELPHNTSGENLVETASKDESSQQPNDSDSETVTESKESDSTATNFQTVEQPAVTPETSQATEEHEAKESDNSSANQEVTVEEIVEGVGHAPKEGDGDTGSSEYDTVDDEEHGVHDDEELGADEEDDEEVLEGEREEGDGEESVPSKPLDDDEDKRNPQYIPKKGGFYEHDDRTMEEIAEGEKEPEPEKPKKVWRADGTDRWTHDRFDPDEQAPKRDGELAEVYGYDIRKEEGAPRARRRRRYGRGPNKYERTWEDTEAYSKPRGRGGRDGHRGRGRGGMRRPDEEMVNNKTEFPELAPGSENDAPAPVEGPKKPVHNAEPSVGRAITGRPENAPRSVTEETKEYHENKEFSEKREFKSMAREQEAPYRGRGLSFKRGGRGRGVERREFRRDEGDVGNPTKPEASVENRGRGNGRVFRGSDHSQPHISQRGRGRGRTNASYSADDDGINIDPGTGYLRVEDKNDSRTRAGSGRIQAHMPPRVQDTTRTKRYSAQRQRTLPETAVSMSLAQNSRSPPVPSALPPRPFPPANIQGAYFDPTPSFQVPMYPDTHPQVSMHQGPPGQYGGPTYAPPPPSNIYVTSNAYAAGPGSYSVAGYAPPQNVPVPMGVESQVCYSSPPYV